MSTDPLDRIFLEPLMAHVMGADALQPLSHRKAAQVMAAMEAGRIYAKHLYNRPCFRSWIDHLVHVARIAAGLGDGLFLEFGVASGTTINAVAPVVPAITGFDSFQGLPEDWRDGVPKGAFAMGVPQVAPNVALRIGMIEDTLPRFLAETPGEVRFLHIDTDLYGPAKFILDQCAPRMQDTLIVFDEFFNYVGWQDHEYKAWMEFQAENRDRFDFDYVACTEEVAVSVRVTRRG
ncbi:hypothetical protein [Falsiroseomonas sp. CW058]|uniref:hypothetical protein n=1 Tax=Falsiroseomonas sp. CW058 TaxID=3388664 RepID=UPI003D31CB25